MGFVSCAWEDWMGRNANLEDALCIGTLPNANEDEVILWSLEFVALGVNVDAWQLKLNPKRSKSDCLIQPIVEVILL